MVKLKIFNTTLVALIDDEDYELVRGYNWQLIPGKHTNYVKTRIDKKTIYLHRFILGITDSTKIDHEDRDGLNNQKSNLRVTTGQGNRANAPKYEGRTSIYKGVYKEKRRKKVCICASIRVNNKHIRLGKFETEEEAALAYNRAAIEHFGEFAFLNKIKANEDT